MNAILEARERGPEQPLRRNERGSMEVNHHLARGRQPGSHFWWQVAAPARNAVAALRRWRQQACDVKQLQELDEHLLRDIGLSRKDVERMAAQSPWRKLDFGELDRQRRLNSRRAG